MAKTDRICEANGQKVEGEATKKMRIAALSFLLNECLGLHINFKSYKAKSTRQNINPHESFSEEKLR